MKITLETIKSRTTEDGDCLVWAGCADRGKFPKWSVDGKMKNARRVIFEALRGGIRSGQQIGILPGCCTLCVNPDHLVAQTRSERQKGSVVSPAVRARIAKKQRENYGIVTEDVARAIRASDEPAHELDKRYGLSSGYAKKIIDGKKWVDYSSPWAGAGRLHGEWSRA